MLERIIDQNDVIELAKRYEVDQCDTLESFICDLLNISSEKLYEEMNQFMTDMATVSFISDAEKMADFKRLSKREFLSSYSYLTEGEYDATLKYLTWLKEG